MSVSSDRKQIVLTVAADGTVRAETKGVVGPSCLDQIAVLEDLLEATTVTSEFTPDYHRTTVSDTAEDIDELYH